MFLRFSGILELFFFNLQVALALKMDFSFLLEKCLAMKGRKLRGDL